MVVETEIFSIPFIRSNRINQGIGQVLCLQSLGKIQGLVEAEA